MRKLRDDAPSEEEIARAKRYLIGNHDIGLQKNSSRSMTLGLDELYNMGYKRSLKYGDYISAVTRQDLQELVDTHLDPARMVVSVTKPAAIELPDDLLERGRQED